MLKKMPETLLQKQKKKFFFRKNRAKKEKFIHKFKSRILEY